MKSMAFSLSYAKEQEPWPKDYRGT
ncbi:hypothetical protein [Sicyoidochytrium minutum DNA virus]|nr:hypothetical protein [Sicyoidochytrium minutum DNA virus]